MLGVNLTSNIDDILNDAGVFSAAQQRSLVSRALNDAARGAVTDGSRKIREHYPKLKAAEVKAAFSIRFATPDNLIATVTAKGRPLSLARFVVQAVTTPGKGGVWVNVKGQSKFFPHAWLQTMKTSKGDDYIVLMAREGAARYPVKVFHTIDIPSSFVSGDVLEYVQLQSAVRFEKRLTAGANYIANLD